jgi:hypothetical protein
VTRPAPIVPPLSVMEREANATQPRHVGALGGEETYRGGAMRIVTEYVYPPIPDRRFDWQAVDDETYDGPGSPIGTGSTEAEAIADLMAQIEDREK